MTVAQFEKVSFEQFYEAALNMIKEMNIIPIASDEDLRLNIKEAYDNLLLPSRATKGSAGYDIHTPIDFTLPPHQTIKIPTGLRCSIEENWFMAIVPRSSLGFKYRLQLDNTVGIIDSDYYFSDNEGHIFIKMTNDNYENKEIKVDVNDRIAQAIFLQYGLADGDNAKETRNGGFGSTN